MKHFDHEPALFMRKSVWPIHELPTQVLYDTTLLLHNKAMNRIGNRRGRSTNAEDRRKNSEADLNPGVANHGPKRKIFVIDVEHVHVEHTNCFLLDWSKHQNEWHPASSLKPLSLQSHAKCFGID